jgi:hypothetical protein
MVISGVDLDGLTAISLQHKLNKRNKKKKID